MHNNVNMKTYLTAMGIAPTARWFFCGIGGAGMNPLAHLLAHRGFRVLGSDAAESPTLERLRADGIECFVGHDAAHVDAADVFVYSTAIPFDNVEFKRARDRRIPCVHRSEVLGLLANTANAVAVAGTHGKTTTSALTAILFEAGGLDPMAVIGGFVPAFDNNFRDGHGDHVIVEADESDGSFVRIAASIAIVLNIDADHLDFYADIDAIETAFDQFLERARDNATIVFNADDERVCRVVERAPAKALRVSCAIDRDADYVATDIELMSFVSKFTVKCAEGAFSVKLGIPGRHNVLNALHAIAAARAAGVAIDAIQTALLAFHGVNRRFQVVGECNGAMVIDDYAHHPSELEAVLTAARQLGRPILAVFQPHRFSRTEKLMDKFVAVLSKFDRLILTDIYAASEKPTGITGETLAANVAKLNANVQYVADIAALAEAVSSAVRPGDIVLCLGAGSISSVAGRVTSANLAATATNASGN